jgi:hypothetical protein
VTALVGIRPARRDGTHDLDPLMIAAAIKACGKYDINVLDFDEALAVVEVLRRDESRAAHWTARCAAEPKRCKTYQRHAERPAALLCCGTPARVTEIHAGWRWVADAVWTMERAVKRGATTPDPKNLWGRFPDACLLGKALREVLKLHCPDALPVGIKVYHEEEPPPAPDREPAPLREREHRQPGPSVLHESRGPRQPRREIQATAALAGAMLGNPAPTVELGDVEREQQAEDDATAAKIDAEAQADARPAVADPDWLEDENTGQASGADPAAQPVHAGGTSSPVPSPAPVGAQEVLPPVPPVAPAGPSVDPHSFRSAPQWAPNPEMRELLAAGVFDPPAPDRPRVYLPKIETLGKDEEIDEPCRECGQAVEPGDRFRAEESGVEFAHDECVKDYEAGVDPKGEDCAESLSGGDLDDQIDAALAVDSASAETVVVPGSRLGASLSLAQWVDSWKGAHESKARKKKAGPEDCEACCGPIHAGERQAERGSERVHVSCLAAGKAGTDPRVSKAEPVAAAPAGLESIGTLATEDF